MSQYNSRDPLSRKPLDARPRMVVECTRAELECVGAGHRDSVVGMGEGVGSLGARGQGVSLNYGA